MLLKVKDVINSKFAVSPENGDKVYTLLRESIEHNKVTVLSFEEMDQITTAFLNHAIAKLYNNFSSDQLNQFIKVTDMDTYDRYLLMKVIERAKLNIQSSDESLEDIKDAFGNE
ncbi:STAS-like domain-containing protein [Bacillus sp. AK031]